LISIESRARRTNERFGCGQLRTSFQKILGAAEETNNLPPMKIPALTNRSFKARARHTALSSESTEVSCYKKGPSQNEHHG